MAASVGALMLAGAGSAGARVPGIDRFGFGADVRPERGADGAATSVWLSGRRAGELVGRAGVAVFVSTTAAASATSVQIDEAEPGVDRIGNAEHAVARMLSQPPRMFCM